MHVLPLCKDRAGEWYDHPDFDIWADGNEWTVEAECSLLVLPLGTAPAISRRISLFCGLSRESAAGHLRALKIECRWLFALFSTGGQATVMSTRIPSLCGLSSETAAGCFALSSQERITPFVCFCGALKRGLRCLFSGLHSQARGASGFVRY
jgi:hypothetical protein